MNKIINDISLYGIVPVTKIECLEDAPYLAKALCEGGLPVAEVTFRTACAKEAIIAMKESLSTNDYWCWYSFKSSTSKFSN